MSSDDSWRKTAKALNDALASSVTGTISHAAMKGEYPDLVALNQAVEAYAFMRSLFSKLRGEQWEALCRLAGLKYEVDPCLIALEVILLRLAAPDAPTAVGKKGTVCGEKI